MKAKKTESTTAKPENVEIVAETEKVIAIEVKAPAKEKEAKVEKPKEIRVTKSGQAIEMFIAGKTVKEIREKLDMRGPHYYTVINKYKKSLENPIEAKAIEAKQPKQEVIKKEKAKAKEVKKPTLSATDYDKLLTETTGLKFVDNAHLTGERGHRLDHCGEEGEDWATPEELTALRKPYEAIWNPKMKEYVKALKKAGYPSNAYMEYGEKGHIEIQIHLA